jgi:hypothetical protein
MGNTDKEIDDKVKIDKKEWQRLCAKVSLYDMFFIIQVAFIIGLVIATAFFCQEVHTLKKEATFLKARIETLENKCIKHGK